MKLTKLLLVLGLIIVTLSFSAFTSPSAHAASRPLPSHSSQKVQPPDMFRNSCSSLYNLKVYLNGSGPDCFGGIGHTSVRLYNATIIYNNGLYDGQYTFTVKGVTITNNIPSNGTYFFPNGSTVTDVCYFIC